MGIITTTYSRLSSHRFLTQSHTCNAPTRRPDNAALRLGFQILVGVKFHASRVNVVRIKRFASIYKSCAQVSPRAYYHPRRTHARCGKAFAQLPACRVMVMVRVRVLI